MAGESLGYASFVPEIRDVRSASSPSPSRGFPSFRFFQRKVAGAVGQRMRMPSCQWRPRASARPPRMSNRCGAGRRKEGLLLQRRAGNGVLKPEIGYYETRNTRRGRTASSEDARGLAPRRPLQRYPVLCAGHGKGGERGQRVSERARKERASAQRRAGRGDDELVLSCFLHVRWANDK